MLNPADTLPVTIDGLDRASTEQLKTLLDAAVGAGRLFTATDELIPILARPGVAWRELDAYVKTHRPKYRRLVASRAPAAMEESGADSKIARQALREIKEDAVEELDVRPYGDLTSLLDGPPADAQACAEVVQQYGVAPLQTYLRHVGRAKAIRNVPADHRERSGFEALVALGLARPAAQIDAPSLLAILSLEELNQLTAGTGAKPFPRKTDATRYCVTLGDLATRLTRISRLGNLFQLQPWAAAVEPETMAAYLRYLTAVAQLLEHTYVMNAMSTGSIAGYRSAGVRWEILPGDDPCPYCERAAGRRGRVAPLHIGCRCTNIACL